MSRLSNYVFRESTRRRRDDRLSLLIAFGFCLLALLMGQPKQSVIVEGLVVLAVSMFWFTFYFCRNAPKILADQRTRPGTDHAILYRPVTRRMAAISATLLAVLSPAPEVMAEVINRRLLRLARDPNLTVDSASEISSALKIAGAIPVRIHDRTRIQVYQAAKISGLMNAESAPIVKCADDLVLYTRDVTFTPTLKEGQLAGSSDARVAFRRGMQSALPALRTVRSLPAGLQKEATDAVDWFSQAIAAAAQDSDVLIGALTVRATLYLLLLRPTDALNDAKKLESIGGTDLSNNLAIEGTALFLRGTGGSREDLERSVRVFTLAIQLEPPTVSVISPELRLVEAFGNRGKAYYGLGQFDKSIDDSRRVVALLKENHLALPEYFRLAYLGIVAANLHLGRIDQAKSAAAAWFADTGDPLAGRQVFLLGLPQFNAQEWLEEYELLSPVQ